jgi:hypothetical protein
VERVEWTGNDFESGITNRLNTDASLVDALSAVANTGRKYDLNPNTWTWVPGVFKVLTGSGKNDVALDLDADPANGLWILTARTGNPSKRLWDCYQLIDHHLLSPS